MREEAGDLWTYPCDARCVTTCGVLKSNGELVMGKGVALEAARRYPGMAKYLGKFVAARGNVVCLYPAMPVPVASFPTKHDWRGCSNRKLMAASATTLVGLADSHGWGTVALPRPGCGNGGLSWAEVQRLLAPILDDRFVVLNYRELR